MAALSITAANVSPGSGARLTSGTAGETGSAGDAVYLDASTNRWKLAKNNGTAAQANCKGVAVNSFADGQPVSVATGLVDIGEVATKGILYVVGTTAGDIEPSTDLTSGERVTYIGVGTAEGNLLVQPHASGTTL